MASVGSILGGAFALLRDRPGTIVIWAVTYCVVSLVISLAMSAVMFGALMPSAADAAQAVQVWMGPSASLVLFLYLCLLLLAVVLMNAVFRAMLRPEEGGFAFMRIGMDEFRMLGLVILAYIAAFVASLIGWLLVLLVTMVIGFVVGPGAVTAAVAFLLFLGFIGALIWAHVRLSLIFPLTFHRRRISVDAAWDLTRGRFWLLFASYFLVGLLFVIASGAMLWVVMGEYLVAMAQVGNDPERMRAVNQAFTAQQFAMPIGTKILFGVVGAVFFAIGLALGPGLLASATRELLGDAGEAAVFAAESDGSIMD